MLRWLKQMRRLHFGDAPSRRRAWHQYLSRKCAENGLEIYCAPLNWLHDPEFQQLSKEWNVRGLPNDRRFFLLASAGATRDIPGDTAECGARFGTSSFFILNGLADSDKQHHIFDSFEGLSTPTEKDHSSDHQLSEWRPGDLSANEHVTRENLQGFPNCRFYKGWIPKRFDEVGDHRFSFVHVDVDLYEPTKASLEFFYPRMNAGGMILCDDYGFSDCPGATQAMDDFFRDKQESILHIPTGQGLVIKKTSVDAQAA
jgi:O-methyltransferase